MMVGSLRVAVVPLLVVLLVTAERTTAAAAAAATPPLPAFATLSDRFRASCPADLSSVRRFEPSLVPPDDGDDSSSSSSTWVAVYRSSNNLPSVLVRDDFLNAMRIATTVQTDSVESVSASSSSSPPAGLETPLDDSSLAAKGRGGEVDGNSRGGEGVMASTPVAVARLTKSEHFPGSYVIDSMRCTLKKEDVNDDCDGGSEFCEAISVCVDELILYQLKQSDRRFDGAVRCKATLYSGRILEERGFVENAQLSKDMATHISSFDGSMNRYAERVVSQAAKNPGARDRALQILSFLGRLDRNEEVGRSKGVGESEKDEDEYDPWAGSTIL